jgi:hypothetical protein
VTRESELHTAIIRHVAERGSAPSSTVLGKQLGWSKAVVRDTLTRLAEVHGLILKPNSFDLWAIHPFSLMPTPIWVEAGTGAWWANCAWCALGIGASLRRDIRVLSRFGAENETFDFQVRNGQATNKDLLIHFPFRPSEWWNNPYNPRGGILFFASHAAVDAWCTRHGFPKGEVIDIATGVALAQAWFGDYLEPTWARKSPEEAHEVFRKVGLNKPFWTS